jgi:hypothetical protein
MKNFINDKEEFVINIPDNWHLLQEKTDEDIAKQPYCFVPYDESDFVFQISYFKSTNKEWRLKNEQPKGRDNLDFNQNNVDGICSWIASIKEGGVILISLSYDSSLDSFLIKDNINKAEHSVKSLVVLDAKTKSIIVPKIRWNNFMLSYGATIDLVNRAYEKGSSFELVVLLASQIDAILRQSIILTQQLKERNDAIEIKFIYQKEKDKPIFEKYVYKKALEYNVISQELIDELFRLYEIRNRAVHRYIISNIKTNDIVELAWSYTKIRKIVGQILIKLEIEQFDKQIGIYKGDSPPNTIPSNDELETYIANIKDKHGNKKISEGITIETNDG